MRIEVMIDKGKKVSQVILTALKAELIKNLLPLYPKTSIRIRKGSANGVELSGLNLDADKKSYGHTSVSLGRRQLATLITSAGPKTCFLAAGGLKNELGETLSNLF